MAYILAYDVGTTGLKSCLYRVDHAITLLESAQCGYSLYLLEGGGAEQDANEWWNAMCQTTRRIFQESDIQPEDIGGISICSQMQGLVLADEHGEVLRRPMSYMDQRAGAEMRANIAHGIKVAGVNAGKLLKSLRITGAVASSVKDPVWKYKWVERCEPEIFKKVHKWLDVKEYLLLRCTGEYVMTEDSAFSTMLYDSRKGKGSWSAAMCKMLGVDMKHLPRVIRSTDPAGTLTKKAADELGLPEGVKVFGGGGDASLIGIGAGCTKAGDTHIYSGTSGWVITVVEKRMVDTGAMVAAIVGAQSGLYNYFAEMETAGKCLEWAKDHLALDEIGVYLEKKQITESQEAVYTSLYDYLTEVVDTVPPGSNGVIFAPWLHGNRCPFEDPSAAGMFFNISLENGKRDMIRAMLEGVCFHLCWMLRCQEKKTRIRDTLRFVGGGALSSVTCQMLSDITGKTIETVPFPQNVGAVGAAAVAAVGLGIIPSLEAVGDMIPADSVYTPNHETQKAYDRNYRVFLQLYKSNKKHFKALNML